MVKHHQDTSKKTLAIDSTCMGHLSVFYWQLPYIPKHN